MSVKTATAVDPLDAFSREDIEAFAKELAAIRKEVRAGRGDQDFAHLRKLERWGRLCTAAGYATGWIAPNPVSAVLIGLGKTSRWAILNHPISHRGYDGMPSIPERYTSKGFAQGWRRFVDWFDWITPDGWHQEHDLLHHFRLGEQADPDQMEINFDWLRNAEVPMALKYATSFVLASTWKWTYYAPTTLMEAQAERARVAGEEPVEHTIVIGELWDPRTKRGRELWSRCYLPYGLFHFALVPAAFLPLGPGAALSTLINGMLGEWVANLHGFLMIAPNHTGDDMVRFDTRSAGRAEYFIRQIVGSVNYRTGGDLNDWLHGWLNYQIEHHVFPNMTLREYQRMQPRVKALCEKYGVPYVQESVWKRAKRTLDVMVGRTSMKASRGMADTHSAQTVETKRENRVEAHIPGPAL